MKLNLGDGGIAIEGYIGRDIARGEEAAVLPYETDSVEEIRASHILEHFDLAQIPKVLAEWVRVLAPGGVLKIAVPDFRELAEQYLAGAAMPIQNYVMGGQSDKYDFHKAIFDFESLADAMRNAGLVGITRWHGNGEDSASQPISLNLSGVKRRKQWPRIVAMVSMPRLGFNDFWACAQRDLTRAGIPLRKLTGAYWDSVLESGMTEALAEDPPAEWILTLDYDTVWTTDQLLGLIETAISRPQIDALAPVQTARHADTQLFTVDDIDGKKITKISRKDLLGGSVIKSASAHFGLTLIRADKLRALPRPWFERKFGAESCDPDVNFWRKWKAAGNTIYTALRVPVGHCELMVKWPSMNMSTVYQLPQEFMKKGAPESVWR